MLTLPTMLYGDTASRIPQQVIVPFNFWYFRESHFYRGLLAPLRINLGDFPRSESLSASYFLLAPAVGQKSEFLSRPATGQKSNFPSLRTLRWAKSQNSLSALAAGQSDDFLPAPAAVLLPRSRVSHFASFSTETGHWLRKEFLGWCRVTLAGLLPRSRVSYELQ